MFYQLLSGADVQYLKALKLHRNVDKYELLRNTFATEDDKMCFRSTKSSLDKLGLSSDEIMSVFKVLAVVLKLGNLNFLPITNIDGTEGCSVSNEFELMEIAQLLDMDAEVLLIALTRSQVEFGGDVDNWTELDAVTATANKNLLCRTLYGRLFAWLANRVNEALKVGLLNFARRKGTNYEFSFSPSNTARERALGSWISTVSRTTATTTTLSSNWPSTTAMNVSIR